MCVSDGKNHTYFEYNSDCPSECITKLESCTINLNKEGVFNKMCYTDNTICENEATLFEVCLQSDKAPKGGQLIWNLYRDKYYPESPTFLYKYNIYVIMITLVCGIFIGIATHRYGHICRCSCFRAEGYGNLRSTEVYRETVEPLSDDLGESED